MKTIILTFAFVIPSVLFGQLDRSVRPEAGPAPTINIKDSEVFKTANGINVILSEQLCLFILFDKTHGQRIVNYVRHHDERQLSSK